MIGIMRSAAIVLAVLVFAVVMAAAGDGACSECVHGCCGRSDGARRLISAVRRLLRSLAGLVEGPAQAIASHVARAFLGDRLLTPCGEVVPLRL